ncbi:MAG: serine protease [Bacteroidales bacterium]
MDGKSKSRVQNYFSAALKMMLGVALLLSLFSCRKLTYQAAYPTLSDGRYDSEFPYSNCSDELDEISQSVKKIYCLVEYDLYRFSSDELFAEADLPGIRLKKKASERGFFSESVHGTATVLKNENNRIVVLTCAHVINYPDTILSFMLDKSGQQTQYLESVAIKKKQTNFIRNLPDGGMLDIIAMDEELDIAFLGNTFSTGDIHIPTFNYPMGDAGELDWGNFVYIFGFPAGYQMVTRGIVSNPKLTKNGEFIIDALFNTGISGGIVLAVRDGVPNFELVGIAKSVSARYKNVLKPENERHQEVYNPSIPYTGEVYVKMEKDINYGVTFTISMGTIRKFYVENRRSFLTGGYSLDRFFGID